MENFSVAENNMFQVDGHDFVFLVRENAIFEVDDRVRKTLEWCSRRGNVTEEDILAFMEDSFKGDRELLEGLIRTHVIAPGRPVRVDNLATPDLRPAAPVPLQTLILQVTEACNLACSYCYYSGPGAGADRKQRERMSTEVAARGIDFLLEHSDGVKKLVLVFFGGEPLLNFKLIASSVDYARGRAEAEGKHVDFALTTNGTLLDDNVVRYLLEQEIGVTVSMDGFAEVHDRHRRFSNGEPSYGKILPGLKKLLLGASRRPPVARVTLTEDPRHVPAILDHLLALGFVEVGFSPVTTNHPAYQLDAGKMDDLLFHFEDLADRFVEAVRKDEFFGFSNLIDLLVVLHQSEVKNYPCGAGLGLFCSDPGGRLYLCQRFAGEESFRMGSVFEGFDHDRLNEFRKGAEISHKEACRQCWARALCAGGCYYEAWVRGGSPFSANAHTCEWIRKWVELGLRTYGRIYLANPTYLDKLAMSRGHASIFNQFYINDRRLT